MYCLHVSIHLAQYYMILNSIYSLWSHAQLTYTTKTNITLMSLSYTEMTAICENCQQPHNCTDKIEEGSCALLQAEEEEGG